MANGQKPDYRVLTSRESGEKTYYTDVGAAWKVSNDGISIQLHALPVDGRLVLFPPREDQEAPAPAKKK
jgi:uncharacterized protein (DUF736 family)